MRMEENDVVGELLEVGQVAEMKSCIRGYRGAWFRCKIRDVFFKRNKVQLEYLDFPDEKVSLTKIYQVPHYGRKSKHLIKKQLMLRPHYPLMMYHKNEIRPVNLASEVCVVIVDGTWKVGDLVDWFKDNCYWSARVIQVLSDDKVQIELPMSPVGEGGTHEAFCRDLRPSLDWSVKEGWRLATMEGESSCSAQLIFPSQQDERECMDNEATAGGEASSTSRISAANANANAIEGENGRRMNSEEVKTEEGKAVCSSEDSISTFHVEESKQDVVGSEYIIGIDKTELNMMHEETFEAAIMDLEELANKINWIKGSLRHNSSSSSSHWEFADYPASSQV